MLAAELGRGARPSGVLALGSHLLSVYRKPIVCGVSSLGIDHTSILGDTIEKIAWQKGGIFKVETMGVCGERGSLTALSGLVLVQQDQFCPHLGSETPLVQEAGPKPEGTGQPGGVGAHLRGKL